VDRDRPIAVLSAALAGVPSALPAKEPTITALTHTQAARITIGVDTHLDVHVAHAIDQLGRTVATSHIPTTPAGYQTLLAWAQELGQPIAWGIEGTSSYGAGLARFLASHDQHVVEVNRPDRAARRAKGKSDPLDAAAAARAVQAGRASGTPKAGTGQVEAIRALRVARHGAVKARTAAVNALKGLVVTAPAELRQQLRGLPRAKLVAACASLPASAADGQTIAIGSLAGRIHALAAEIALLDQQLDRLVATAAPSLVALFGVGTDSAGALLVAAGDNPQRLHCEAALAALCGVSPVQASSGKTSRHRLNRGGDRQANAALYRIAIVRLRHDPSTQAYLARRSTQGKSKREVIRCLIGRVSGVRPAPSRVVTAR
jgi:transposase